MNPVHCLLVAKAPVPGQAKTRLGAEIGMTVAAEAAAAALLDSMDACRETFGVDRCHLALTGDLSAAARSEEIILGLTGWTVFEQVGHGFGDRLANAHSAVGRRTGAAVVQIGMDTPQVTPGLLSDVAAGLADHDGVLGPAPDGGWWVLGLRDTVHATVLSEVPTSTTETGALTRQALEARGLSIGEAVGLRDVDTASDAHAVAADSPGSRFAAVWSGAAASVEERCA